jgi:hypothetical protein
MAPDWCGPFGCGNTGCFGMCPKGSKCEQGGDAHGLLRITVAEFAADSREVRSHHVTNPTEQGDACAHTNASDHINIIRFDVNSLLTHGVKKRMCISHDEILWLS